MDDWGQLRGVKSYPEGGRQPVPSFVKKSADTDRPAPQDSVPVDVERLQPAWRQVLALAWPVLLQQLLILAVTLSDSFLAGYFPPQLYERSRGESGLPEPAEHASFQAAQTTAQYLAWFIASYTVLVSVGSTALVARFVGAGNRASAIRATNQSVLVAAFLGLVGSTAGLAGIRVLVQWLQLRGAAALLASAYLQPLFVLLPFQIIGSAGIACLVGAGDTRTGFWVLGGVALLNLPLAWGFFHGVGPLPAWGFEGIALGTAISQTIGGLTVLALLARGRAGLTLRASWLLPDWNLIWRLLRVSVPAGIDSLSVVVGQFWFLSIVNRLGDAASSAHGIALRWEALGYLSGAAFGTAAMTLVGQNLGARRPERAARCGWVAFGLGAAMMCGMGLVFFTLAPQMFLLFCPHPDQQPIVTNGVPVLRLVAFAMLPLASCIIFTFALRGAGDTRIPVLFTWVGFLCVRIPLAYVLTQAFIQLPFGVTLPGYPLGLFGAWLAMFADLLVRGGFFLYRFRSGRWQLVEV
jgi:putative MATE family efflux protein